MRNIEYYKALGKRLKKHRLENKYSSERIARIYGVSFQQITKYENGINRPPCDFIKLYGDLFCVDTNILLDVKLHQMEFCFEVTDHTSTTAKLA